MPRRIRYKWIIVAEKPSVARRIENLRIPFALVIPLRGHIFDVDFPEGYDWHDVPPSQLFDVEELELVVVDQEAYNLLKKKFSENKDATLVIATDNDPEGELIGWEVAQIYKEVLKKKAKPFYRMRFNTTDYQELKRAWREKETGLSMRWVEKASFRRNFDFITGAAFTRLLTLSTRRAGADVRVLSWGSCQAPTLYFVVEREKEILNFKPEKFWRIAALLETEDRERFWAFSDKIKVKENAERNYNSIKREKTATVKEYKESIRRILRPLPTRTDELLRDMSKLFGIPANKTLMLAEELYGRGYISYPRTDTNMYREDFNFVKYAEIAARGLGLNPMRFLEPNPRQGTRYDGAHTPIYPIKPFYGEGNLRKIWEHIARRFLANAFYSNAEQVRQEATILIKGIKLYASGTRIVKEGFFEVLPYARPPDDPIPRLRRGQKLRIIKLELREQTTKPPPRLTESDLLKIMEKWNIGTDATRAIYPALIIDRGYAIKRNKTFHPTFTGFKLIEQLAKVDESLVSPETRRRVEEMMEKIERGEADMEVAMKQMIILYKKLFEKLESRMDEVARTLADAIGYGKKPLIKSEVKAS